MVKSRVFPVWKVSSMSISGAQRRSEFVKSARCNCDLTASENMEAPSAHADYLYMIPLDLPSGRTEHTGRYFDIGGGRNLRCHCGVEKFDIEHPRSVS